MRELDAIEQVRDRIFDPDNISYPESVDTSSIAERTAYQKSLGTLRFTDAQILSEVKFAVSAFNSDYSIESIPKDKEFIPITKACIACLRALAMRSAKYYKISVDGISLSKSDAVKNYLDIAKALEDGLAETLSSANFAEIEVQNASRYNVRTNTMSYSEQSDVPSDL